MTIRNILLALSLSIIITFAVTGIYLFYPLISELLRHISNGPETSGIAAVAGGASWPGLVKMLFTEILVFVLVLALLRGKGKN